jgi:hypothetical protein
MMWWSSWWWWWRWRGRRTGTRKRRRREYCAKWRRKEEAWAPQTRKAQAKEACRVVGNETKVLKRKVRLLVDVFVCKHKNFSGSFHYFTIERTISSTTRTQIQTATLPEQ